jgi:hypothetical protein
MTKLTYTEWWQRVHDAYADELCPHCGYVHGSVSPDELGSVWLYCPNADREYCVGFEQPPDEFASPPDDAPDLPF